MGKLDIQIRLLDVIEEREATAFELKATNNGEEAMIKYRTLDKEMNDLIKMLANGQTKSQIQKKSEFNNLSKLIKEDLAKTQGLWERCCTLFIKHLDGISTNEEIKELDNILKIKLPSLQKETERKMYRALATKNYLG